MPALMDFSINLGPIATPMKDPTLPGPIAPRWYYTDAELRRTPSIISGCSFNSEQQQIMRGCTLIRAIADRLNEYSKESGAPKISQLSVSVSMMQLRRFFVSQKVQSFDARDMAAAILFLTAKSEECPRRLEHIVRAWMRIRMEMDTPKERWEEPTIMTTKAYHSFCEYITLLEGVFLQSIGFNVQVDVPHPIALNAASYYRKEDKKFAESVFWLVTDALHITTWAVKYAPPVIACACFYLTLTWRDPNPTFPRDNDDGTPWYQNKKFFQRGEAVITMDTINDMVKEFFFMWNQIDQKKDLYMSQFSHSRPSAIMERFITRRPNA